MSVIITPGLWSRYRRYASAIQAAESSSPVLAQYPGLLAGVLAAESGFNAAAVHQDSNGTTDIGIAQLNSAYYPVATAQDPTAAIQAAANTLASNIEQCGSVEGALYKYNSGSCQGVGGDRGYPARVLRYTAAINSIRGTSGAATGSQTAAGALNPSGLPHPTATGFVLIGLGIVFLILAAVKLR